MGDQTAASCAYVVQLLVPQRAMLDILVAGLLRLRVLTRLLLSILTIAHIAIPRSNIRIIDPTKNIVRDILGLFLDYFKRSEKGFVTTVRVSSDYQTVPCSLAAFTATNFRSWPFSDLGRCRS